jgi:hypothetical protein
MTPANGSCSTKRARITIDNSRAVSHHLKQARQGPNACKRSFLRSGGTSGLRSQRAMRGWCVGVVVELGLVAIELVTEGSFQTGNTDRDHDPRALTQLVGGLTLARLTIPQRLRPSLRRFLGSDRSTHCCSPWVSLCGHTRSQSSPHRTNLGTAYFSPGRSIHQVGVWAKKGRRSNGRSFGG